jgi:phosphatidylglycerophosphatase A
MTEPPRPDLRFVLSSPAAFLTLGGGAGLVPRAPGTAGSLLAVPMVLILQGLPLPWQIAVWVAMCVAGVWLCDRVGKRLGDADHPAIVWDEICGTTIVLLLAPPGLGWMLAGFLAFRVFDIVKPWPINVIDRRFANGFGAMGDDLMAAAYAIATIGIASQITQSVAA